MVDDLAVARFEIHRGNVHRLGEMRFENEVPIQIRTICRELKCFRQREYEVRFPERPLALVRWWRHKVLFETSSWRACIIPSPKGFDLRFAKRVFKTEFAETVNRLPRRHLPSAGDVRHHRRPFLGVCITDEGKRRHFSRAMALNAMLLQDRHYVRRVIHRTGFWRRGTRHEHASFAFCFTYSWSAAVEFSRDR